MGRTLTKQGLGGITFQIGLRCGVRADPGGWARVPKFSGRVQTARRVSGCVVVVNSDGRSSSGQGQIPEDKRAAPGVRFSNEELKHLLGRCLRKDEKAWETLFRGLYGLVKDVVLRVGLKDEDVDDAVAEAFSKMVFSIRDVARSKSPVAYVGAIARYTALRIRKYNQSHPQEPLEPREPDEPRLPNQRGSGSKPNQGVSLMAKRVNDELKAALGRLRPAERRLLRLKYVEDLCYEEVAWIVARDVSATRVATHRVVQKLRSAVCPEVREMLQDKDELWNWITSLEILEAETPKEPPSRTQRLLEDYVADRNSMDPNERREIEAALENEWPLRERKVRLERALLEGEDVTAHWRIEDEMSRELLSRLMGEVRRGDW